MKEAIKDIIIIFTAVFLLIGGLGIALNLQVANGWALVAVIIFGAGGALLAYFVKRGRR